MGGQNGGTENNDRNKSNDLLAVGLALGVAFGLLLDSLALGLALGAAFGVLAGWKKGKKQ